MKQVIRKGLKNIIVDEVPDPMLLPHHVLVRPLYSLISSGTETASIHRDSLLSEVADNPSHLRKIWDVAMKAGPIATLAEVRAKFSEYAVLGYSGAGVVAARHATVTDLEIGERVAVLPPSPKALQEKGVDAKSNMSDRKLATRDMLTGGREAQWEFRLTLGGRTVVCQPVPGCSGHRSAGPKKRGSEEDVI